MKDLVFKGSDEQVLTSSLIVAETFGKRHDHVLRDVCELLEKDAPKIGGMFVETVYSDTYGREKKMYAMTRDGFSLLVMGFTGSKALEFKVAFIEAFNKMERSLKEVRPSSLLEDRMKAAEWAIRIMNMNEVSKLRLTNAILEPLGLPTETYVKSAGVTHSATHLLKESGSHISTVYFNKCLVEMGILQENKRKSSGGMYKYYKTLTEKGCYYGENLVNEKCPKETQPYYYDSKFDELLNEVHNYCK